MGKMKKQNPVNPLILLSKSRLTQVCVVLACAVATFLAVFLTFLMDFQH